MKKKNILVIIFLLLSFFHVTTLLKNEKFIVTADINLDKNSFISEMSKAAVEDMKLTGVYASVTLGQAAVESGWGANSIAVRYKNYFGMKTGATIYVNGAKTTCNAANYGVIGKSNSTNPYWSGTAVCLGASEGGYSWFRVYDSMANSVKDHSRNLWCISDGRYVKNGVFASPDPQTQLYNIARSGYAVDKNGNVTVTAGRRYDDYIYNLIITPNNFEQYDQGYQKIKPDYAYDCTTAEYTGVMPSIKGTTTSIMSYTTSYTGDIKKGYINENQTENALIYTEDESDDSIKNKVFNIINNIFGRASDYNSSSSSKPGASAYIAKVEYYKGNFKNEIRYFNQYDYREYPYSTYGTIRSHGCGPTSMAIVLSSFFNKNISPVDLTNWACSHGYCSSNGTAHEYICAQAKEYGLNCERLTNAHDSSSQQKVVSALGSGNALVVMLARTGHFTNSGHFIVLTGETSDGKITVHDPGHRDNTNKQFSFDFLLNPTQGHAEEFYVISG